MSITEEQVIDALRNVDDPDLKKVADEEGWILNPDNKNIDKPLATYDED